ncbi:hypothetical protein DASB73_009790 [Starmerella bacillaris]|uniref:4'-phosphopantetheinyl transferase domain-containing protein n=1 Tax=Starmerella bacillaris TaxID=1247836 RepID=A0AAV5RHH1_STABA|nr:hypothetical protein DASB73_009790 [Starmerella bacillaris]
MTVLGVGVDVVRTSRFAEILKRSPTILDRISKRILHPVEHTNYQSSSQARQLQILASTWAVKEATFKSLSIGDQRRFKFAEWRRVNRLHGYEMIQTILQPQENDKPSVIKEVIREDRILVSTSHDGDYTIANALRQTTLNNVA